MNEPPAYIRYGKEQFHLPDECLPLSNPEKMEQAVSKTTRCYVIEVDYIADTFELEGKTYDLVTFLRMAEQIRLHRGQARHVEFRGYG